eukprot:TRINITY_DN5515_c0_g1_i1.p1 TRINITY_DN5515_c0_g1~~TRINITY_DN5515_c0_g1_i1.p1  ORF type:complete len:293 (+),score=79.84 TRINITY_DN5515_c0_g1_i1:381-1259(+)
MEIDPHGRMWIVDCGFLNLFDEERFEWHTPRLIILDIDSLKVLHVHEFSPHVAIPPESFLNDLVLDLKHGFVYISDAREQGGLIVYDVERDVSWRFDHSTFAARSLMPLTFCDHRSYPIGPTGFDGIALHPDATTLYYCPLASFELYSIPVSVITNQSTTSQQLSAGISHRGTRPSISDGMAFDAAGNLYFADMQGCSVRKWTPDGSSNVTDSSSVLIGGEIAGPRELQWADTFGFDQNGNLLIATNRLQQFVNGETDYSGASGSNYHLLSTHIGHRSYMEPEAQRSPAPLH